MKKNTKIFTCMLASILSVMFILTGCDNCGYQEDYTYTKVNPGKLPNPSVAVTDPKYRDTYGTLTPYDEEVEISVAAVQYDLETGVKPGTTPEHQAFNDIAKKYLNIKLKYDVVAASTVYDTKINLAIAAGTMPDMFYTTSSTLYSSLKDDGKLADLGDVFWYLNDELQANYLKDMPNVLPTVMEEGKLFALPMLVNTYAAAQRLYLRKDWLEIAGVKAPTNIDEMIAVGAAFVEHKAEIAEATGIKENRVIPFTMNKEVTWQGSYSAEGFFNAYGSSVGSYFEGSDGELYASSTDENTKKALTALNGMYKNGILDREFLSKSAEQIQANLKAGYVGMVFGEWWLPKDALDDNVSNMANADWTWVDIPSAVGVDSKPVVSKVAVAGYNLVSKDCKHPEAVAKLINLFYDIYYSDDSADRYVSDSGEPLTLPANGFYHQFVPIKLWDGVASTREHKRVQSVFNGLYEKGFYNNKRLTNGLYQAVKPAEVLPTDYQIGSTTIDKVQYMNVLNRAVVAELKANAEWWELFNSLRTREKVLHFADGYPYFSAYKQGIKKNQMTKSEIRGWGIYHEMIDENGSYAYVVNLTEGKAKAKYNEFYGAALSTMTNYGDYLTTQTNKIFTQIITGEKDTQYFETFVNSVYMKNGGEKILSQINAWYKAQPKGNS